MFASLLVHEAFKRIYNIAVVLALTLELVTENLVRK
jgi:hypothetical protein